MAVRVVRFSEFKEWFARSAPDLFSFESTSRMVSCPVVRGGGMRRFFGLRRL